MEIDYSNLSRDLESGGLRESLESQLIAGYREMRKRGEPIPPSSYYASKIAEIVYEGAEEPIDQSTAFYLYQEILLACERARASVMGQPLPEIPDETDSGS